MVFFSSLANLKGNYKEEEYKIRFKFLTEQK